MIETFIEYAPIILVVFGFAVSYRLFVTPNQLAEQKTELFKYIAEHYVSHNTYFENNKTVQEQLSQIHQDISDIKNLLIQRGGGN